MNIRVLLLALCALFVGGLRRSFATANVEGVVGTHETTIRRYTDAAVATRYLLFKKGTDADHVAVCGAADVPLGNMVDEADAAERDRHIHLLGRGPTKKLVASEAIAAGVQIFTAASGKVQDLPTASGTYYLVGVALTAAGADGDLLEANDCAPVKLVIP